MDGWRRDDEKPAPNVSGMYGLLGGIACGTALLCAGWSAYLSFLRLPMTRQMLADFGATVPAPTRLLLDYPWVPFALSILAGGAGCAAWARIRLSNLALAYVLNFVSIASILFAQYAIDSPWMGLMLSVQGR